MPRNCFHSTRKLKWCGTRAFIYSHHEMSMRRSFIRSWFVVRLNSCCALMVAWPEFFDVCFGQQRKFWSECCDRWICWWHWSIWRQVQGFSWLFDGDFNCCVRDGSIRWKSSRIVLLKKSFSMNGNCCDLFFAWSNFSAQFFPEHKLFCTKMVTQNRKQENVGLGVCFFNN